jgi:hypothetical protein
MDHNGLFIRYGLFMCHDGVNVDQFATVGHKRNTIFQCGPRFTIMVCGSPTWYVWLHIQPLWFVPDHDGLRAPSTLRWSDHPPSWFNIHPQWFNDIQSGHNGNNKHHSGLRLHIVVRLFLAYPVVGIFFPLWAVKDNTFDCSLKINYHGLQSCHNGLHSYKMAHDGVNVNHSGIILHTVLCFLFMLPYVGIFPVIMGHYGNYFKRWLY